jgi:hypothetical protein
MNILYLDNDECLGYFSLISGLYTETVCDYCLKLKLEEKNLDRINAEALFILFAAELLDMGFARPGLKEFFYKLKKFKNNKFLDKIIMYTSAERYSQSEKNFVNWVGFMKNLFEFYSTEKHDDSRDLFLIYDLDHSGRSDEIPRESPDGATLKSVEVPLKRLGISMDDVGKIVFLDDRPQNIFIDGKEQQDKLMRIGVLPYYFLPQKEILKQTCAKYDEDFMKLGMKSLTSILDKQYDNELDEFKENGYPIGIPHFDMSELEEKKNNARMDTPPSSIDISGEAVPSKNYEIQIGDSDTLSLDITKMLEKSVPNDTKSIDFSYELSKSQSYDNSEIAKNPFDIDISSLHQINNDFKISDQNVKSLQSSINISNVVDEKPNAITKADMQSIDLKPTDLYNEFVNKVETKPSKLEFKDLSEEFVNKQETKPSKLEFKDLSEEFVNKQETKPSKLEFKDLSEEFGTKKDNEKKSSVISNIIDVFKAKQQVAGDKKTNKDKLLFDQIPLNDVSALSISQNAMVSQSIDISNELQKGKVDNFSIEISKDYKGGLPSIDISRELRGENNSINISKDINSGLTSIDISNELNGGLPSIDISNELNGGASSINLSSVKNDAFGNIKHQKKENNLPFLDLNNFSLNYN